MDWRLVDTGFNAAAINMAMDEALLMSQAVGMSPTLRLYGWRPAAVSLGFFQKGETEIDFSVCRKWGMDVVRRLTGGRAVLHDAELTYSITVREDHPLIPKSITASYLLFSNCLLAVFRALGVEAQLSTARSDYRHRGGEGPTGAAACFDTPSLYEITVEGRKLVGSAQVRKNGVLLQHGSILLDFSPDMVANTLRPPEPVAKLRLATMLGKRATSLKEQLGRTVTWQEVAVAISKAFGPSLGINLIPDDLTAGEKLLTRKLAATKYSQDSWNRMR
jgi:lipoate-protein ligase A